MAGLVYRYEIIARTVCKGKEKKEAGKYIFVSEDVKYSGEEGVDAWQGRIKGIKLEIDKVMKKENEEQKKNEEWQKKQEEQYHANQKKNEEWKQ